MSEQQRPSPAELAEAVERLLGHLEAQARADARLAEAVVTLGRWLVQIAQTPPPARPPEAQGAVESPAPAAPEPPAAPEAIRRFVEDFGREPERQTPAPAPLEPAPVRPDPADLEPIRERMALKAEAAALLRSEQPPDPEAVAALTARAARLPRCDLWLLRDPAPASAELEGSYRAAAEAAGLLYEMLKVGEPPRELPEALALAAEAQSALREAVFDHLYAAQAEPDQLALFGFIAQITRYEQIYVRRHMRLEDPASPAQHQDLRGRIQGLHRRWWGRVQQPLLVKRARRRIKYHADLLLDERTFDPQHDLRVIEETLDELRGLALRLPDAELSRILEPLLPRLSPGAARALGPDPAGADDAEPPEADEPITGEALGRAAALLSGRTVAIIGGERRLEAAQRLERAFGLRELIWVETSSHQSFYDFEPPVIRADLVLLAIRWASHSFARVRELCELHGKTLVRLPTGYGVNQVAHQVLEQAGERLQEQSGG